MVMRLLTLVLILGLSACATTPPHDYPEVYKRVPYCPMPPDTERPILDIETYGWDKNNLMDNPQILLVSINQLKDYSMKLEKIIESFRKYSDDSNIETQSAVRVSTNISTDYPAAMGAPLTDSDWNEPKMFNFVDEYKRLQEYREKNRGE